MKDIDQMTQDELYAELDNIRDRERLVNDALEKWDRIYRKEVGKRIRDLRKNANLTQEQLAVKARIERSTVTNIELANQKPSIDHLIAFCRIFDCSPIDIIGKL